jgi:hypothetical protein
MKEDKRTNEQIIHDGNLAVQSVLNECSDDRKHEFQLSEYDLAVLVRHYSRYYLDASDLLFLYGQAGGEREMESWADNQLNDLSDLLDEKANDMIKAVQREKESEERKGLSDEGLKLYEGLVDGTVGMEQWHNWNHKQVEQHFTEMA